MAGIPPDSWRPPHVCLETTMGNVTVELYWEHAPRTCKNFAELARRGYYNGTKFHRIIKDFMVQGGDPTGTGRGGGSIYDGKHFADELQPELKFTGAGILAMANAGPDTNGSQFFLTLAPSQWLDGKHTIFGRVCQGIGSLNRLGMVETDGQDRALDEGSNVEFARTGYGKDAVKVLQIKRDGKQHYIKEIEASVQLTLKSKKDYLEGDNADIIPTDTIKNTVYALAKLKGITTIEDFSMNICDHFFTSFNHVTDAKVYIEEAPWKRFEKDGAQHVHAFIYSSEGVHFCEVSQKQGGQPIVNSGIKDLRVLKTTQSGFEGFVKDRYTTLPEVKDRCFSTVVNCKWRYNKSKGVNFESIWRTMKDIILDKFAGPYDKGEYSPSVQKTLYDIQLSGLSNIPEIEEIDIALPNKHYFTIDLSKFGLSNQDEVLLPSDKPYGNITGSVQRKPISKL